MRKLTQSEFLEQATKANPHLDFSKANYVNKRTKVTVRCPKHGDFEVLAGSCDRRLTCPSCNLEDRKRDFIEKAKIIHEGKYDYSKIEYKNNKIPVEIICPIHGSFMQTPSDHLKGWGCSKCSKKHKPTTQEWIEEAKKIFPQYDYSKVQYIDNKTPVTLICPIHGEFQKIPNNLLAYHSGCRKCSDEQRARQMSKTTEEFIEQARKVHGDYYDYSKVQYINKLTPVTIICPKHGEFQQVPYSHLCGYGCHKCKNKNQTKIFNILCNNFPNVEILYEVGNKVVPWINNLRFDMYIPEYNIAIEYDGQQHFIPIKWFGGEEKLKLVQERDNRKNILCAENGCKLFRIPYNYTNQFLQDILKSIGDIIANSKNREPEYVDAPE